MSDLILLNDGLRVSTRPTIRLDQLQAVALALWCEDEVRNTTQAFTLAVKQMLPPRYIEMARARLAQKKKPRARKGKA